MTSLAEALQYLGFVPLVDFIVQDDSEGPYLHSWLSAEPQPGGQAIADAIAAVEAAPDPTRRQLQPWYFAQRFTQGEQLAFYLSVDPGVVLLRGSFLASRTIGLDDPRVVGGLDVLVAAGVMEAGRKAALLADRTDSEKAE